LDGIQIRLLAQDELSRAQQLLDEHHYLGGLKPVGERLHYAVTDAHGDWLGVLVFCAAARRLRPRDQGIGWSDEQRRRRLPLIASNTRFLLLPHKTVPNLASKTLAWFWPDSPTTGRPATAIPSCWWRPSLIRSTSPAPSTPPVAGPSWGRHARDFYVRHDQPKRLFCRVL
jgi:hypothetical protein